MTAAHLTSDRFYMKKKENMDTTPIPRSQVIGEVEPGLLDELRLEYEDRKFPHWQKSTRVALTSDQVY